MRSYFTWHDGQCSFGFFRAGAGGGGSITGFFLGEFDRSVRSRCGLSVVCWGRTVAIGLGAGGGDGLVFDDTKFQSSSESNIEAF